MWNEVLAFDINEGDQDLKVQLYDNEPESSGKTYGRGQRKLIGAVSISLRDLSADEDRWNRLYPNERQAMQNGDFYSVQAA